MANILLIDINGLGYAAMYTPMGKLEHEGQPTGGIHGAVLSVLSRLDEYPDATPVVLWDNRADWRYELWPQYKMSRGDDPVKAAIRARYGQQIPAIKEYLHALGVPQVECAGAEADDLAGVILRRIDPALSIAMISRDTDWLQGLRANVIWHSPVHKKRLTLEDLANPSNGLADGHFLSPFEYLQAKALAGDSSDEIPGVQGVGLKTAAKLIREHQGDVLNFWAAVDAQTLQPKGVIHLRLASKDSREIFDRNLRLMDWGRAPEPSAANLQFSCPEPSWQAAERLSQAYGLAKVQVRAKAVLSQRIFAQSDLEAVKSALAVS